MATVDAEKKLQKRVLGWLVNDLGYTYLGNLEDVDNTCVKEDLLRKNLKKRGYSKEQIDKAVNELVLKTKNQVDSLYSINKEVYALLRYGKQGVRDNNGNRPTVHYIDWTNIDNNDFYVAEEVSVLREDNSTRKRPDVVIYINGIVLGIFELKSSYVSSGKGIRQLLQNQKKENIQNFFSTAQLLFAGNESEGLFYGTIRTPEKYYLKWKEDKKATDSLSAKIKTLQIKEVNRLRDGVISLCQKERFLSIIHDFIIFDAGVKKVTRHNQYFANIAARQRIKGNEGGIIWNTQGSGKSLIMVWLTKWIIENINDSRVVIITDRDELDDQIESLFFDVGENVTRAKSCANLREILDKNEDNIVCSLIHKYGHNAGKQADIDQYRKELIKDLPAGFKAKGNIIAFIDECHRTNSGKLHEAVKALMPDAVLIGFTGTPLLKKDKQTSLEIFGTYIHTYKFDEGVEDGVVSYASPKLSSVKSERCNASGETDNDGTYFLSTTSAVFPSCLGKNALTLTVKYKRTDLKNYGNEVQINPGSNVCANNDLDPEYSCDVLYTLSDEFNTVTYSDFVSTAVYLMHFLHGGRTTSRSCS